MSEKKFEFCSSSKFNKFSAFSFDSLRTGLKTNLNVIRQIGNKAKDKFSINKLLDSKQKPAKIIPLNPNKNK